MKDTSRMIGCSVFAGSPFFSHSVVVEAIFAV